MARTNNLLTQPQAARLYAWLEANRVYAAGHTAQVIAVGATETLGFGVTESNVGTARRALGITKPKPVQAATGCNCPALAAALVELYRIAGATPPTEVERIAAGTREKRVPVTFEGRQQRFELVEA